MSLDIYEERGKCVYYISSRTSTSSNLYLSEQTKEYISSKRKCPIDINDLISSLEVNKESIFDRPSIITLKQTTPSKINERVFYTHGGYSYSATIKRILKCEAKATEKKVDLIVQYEVSHTRQKSLCL